MKSIFFVELVFVDVAVVVYDDGYFLEMEFSELVMEFQMTLKSRQGFVERNVYNFPMLK